MNTMKLFICTAFIGILISCNSQQPKEVIAMEDSTSIATDTIIDPILIDTAALGLNFEPKFEYNSVKSTIRRTRISKNTGKDFENYLLNDIIPHWYGTEWDFNGYTSVPNKGVIACGYFVSTTLEHVGIKINRYHLAQQAGLNEAKSLALSEDNYRTIWGLDSLETIMKRDYEDGLYFVGLDNHVGYLYMKNKELYFIHSNYIEDKVMLEKAIYAPAFQSNIYVIAELSTNELLLERWRKGETVPVIRN